MSRGQPRYYTGYCLVRREIFCSQVGRYIIVGRDLVEITSVRLAFCRSGIPRDIPM